MASAGNPNQPGAFDLQKLFKPSNPNPPNPNPSNPNGTSPFPPSSYPPPPSTYPTPPPGPFSYPPQTSSPFHHYLHYAQDPLPNVQFHRQVSYPTPPPHMPPSNPNPGARLMALLSPNPPANHELPLSAAAAMSEFSVAAVVPSAPPVPQPTPMRLPSSKLPKGRHLSGDRVVYDINARMPGEVKPQLEVTPITKYVSDPGLVVGRQITVNRTYICYGLKLGAIRVLNINTALRSLLRGHTQRVTDMAFFAEDVHLLASSSTDGRVFVWKINEGPDDEDKPEITGKVIVAIQIVGERESFHPRICWHSHKQEILVVAIGKHVLKIDTTKVGKGEVISAEEPIKCLVEKLIDGVQFVGKHKGEVTDLSMCQWMTTRLVSASTDGTVKIWEDRKALPLLTLRPHDGQPVNSATFLRAPHRPDHIVLITGGHLNREVKVWASASEEGWLLPSDSESWKCTQTLDLKSSAEPRPEGAFFNQVVVLPRAGLILLANAKKNAIYAVHLEYGPYPAATRMDYIAEFTVTMPILSLTGTSDSSPDGEHVQVYCVQTQAIQQYALDLSQCLPLSLENAGMERDSCISRFFETPSSDAFTALELSHGNSQTVTPFSGAPDIPSLESAMSGIESRPSTFPQVTSDVGNIHVTSPPVPLSPRLSGKLAMSRSPSNSFEHGPPLGDYGVDPPVLDYLIDNRGDAFPSNLPNEPPSDNNTGKYEIKVGQSDISMMSNVAIAFKHPTHLVTPSEILSKAVSSPEITLIAQALKGGETNIHDVVKNDVENEEIEVKVVGESGLSQLGELDSPRQQHIIHPDKKEKSFYSQTTDLRVDMTRECCSLSTEISTVVETCQVEDDGVSDLVEQQPGNGYLEDVQDSLKDAHVKIAESSAVTAVTRSPSPPVKGKKQKGKPSQASGPSSPSPSPFNSMDSSNEPVSSLNVPSAEAIFAQIQAMQETLNQLMMMQKEIQKQMSVMVAGPVNKEGRRLEMAVVRSIEKALKANGDALWARMQEEIAKHEKLERDRTQQMANLITTCVNKDLPAMLERLKKEISAIGPAVGRAITPIMEKTISSAVAESFQRGVGDKAVNQLDKSVNLKLEATVARQIQAQFQTSGKQALQDVLKSSLESSVIPAFEQSCKLMFEQVDTVFQKGMVEHATAAHQQFESSHSPLALALRDAMSSASSITQSLTGELADGQRKLLALVAAGSSPKAMNPLATHLSNGPLGGFPDMVEAPLDPTAELQRFISERKFGEAFTAALQRSDVSLVSWLCSQVDLQGILSMIPLPLSQGVLLALIQQLACAIINETSRKLEWMRDAAVAINPTDPMIAMHVRPIFEQVYQILGHQRTSPTTTATEANGIRLVMHVINSVLMSCK